MSGKISSIVSSSEKLDISKMSFEERLQYGAENAVSCMGVTSHDRVFIITDYERENIARRIAVAALDRHADVTIRFLEHYGARPLSAFPDELRDDLLQTRPTVSYYVATAKPGEIRFRMPLLPFLVQELKVRHGHMIGIDEEVMVEGMCADYDEVFSLTNQVYDLVRNAQIIHVTSARGSDVTATFHQDWQWIPCHGRYHEQGKWGNLPEGEVFTAPATVDGILVCDVLGDFFSEKYGVLEHPIIINVKQGYIKTKRCPACMLPLAIHIQNSQAPIGMPKSTSTSSQVSVLSKWMASPSCGTGNSSFRKPGAQARSITEI